MAEHFNCENAASGNFSTFSVSAFDAKYIQPQQLNGSLQFGLGFGGLELSILANSVQENLIIFYCFKDINCLHQINCFTKDEFEETPLYLEQLSLNESAVQQIGHAETSYVHFTTR